MISQNKEREFLGWATLLVSLVCYQWFDLHGTKMTRREVTRFRFNKQSTHQLGAAKGVQTNSSKRTCINLFKFFKLLVTRLVAPLNTTVVLWSCLTDASWQWRTPTYISACLSLRVVWSVVSLRVRPTGGHKQIQVQSPVNMRHFWLGPAKKYGWRRTSAPYKAWSTTFSAGNESSHQHLRNWKTRYKKWKLKSVDGI